MGEYSRAVSGDGGLTGRDAAIIRGNSLRVVNRVATRLERAGDGGDEQLILKAATAQHHSVQLDLAGDAHGRRDQRAMKFAGNFRY